MALDPVERAHAQALYESGLPQPENTDATQKAKLYGAVAIACSRFDLDAVRKQVVRPDATSYSQINGAAIASFLRQIREVLKDDPVLNYSIEEMLDDGPVQPIREASDGIAPSYLRLGLFTMLNVESSVVNTLRKHHELGDPIRPKSVYVSQRAVFGVALFHFLQITSDVPLPTETHTFANDEALAVIQPGAYKVSNDSGITLIHRPPDVKMKPEPTNPAWSRFGPQIGCPVTLISGFVRETHAILADATLAAGLLPDID